MNQGTLSRARKLLCLKIVVAFHTTIKKSKKKTTSENTNDFITASDKPKTELHWLQRNLSNVFSKVAFYYHIKNSQIFPIVISAEYAKILAQRQKEAKEMRIKRPASLRESRNSVESS